MALSLPPPLHLQALKHDRKFHTGVKDYECRVCEAEVTDIAVHMKVHVTEKEFVCAHCPARFRHKNSLIRHMCQHTGERPYACPDQRCSAAFIAPHRLKEHVERCHVVNQLKRRHLAEEKELPEDEGDNHHRHLGDVLGDEESRALVADLMLEGCSDVILTEERDLSKTAEIRHHSRDTPKKLPSSDETTKSKDIEVEIIDEKKHVLLSHPLPQHQTLLQPLVLPTLTALQPIQPVVMSLVTGTNGQIYLLPTAAATQPPTAQAQQPQTIILSSWPTPPSSVSPAASILSPTSVLSPAECPEVQGRFPQSNDRVLMNLN